MKNQYVGDIGDYGKYGLLRFLAGHGIKIGINWYLTENDRSADGKFTDYLKRPEERIYDPVLFDVLKECQHDRAGRNHPGSLFLWRVPEKQLSGSTCKGDGPQIMVQ